MAVSVVKPSQLHFHTSSRSLGISKVFQSPRGPPGLVRLLFASMVITALGQLPRSRLQPTVIVPGDGPFPGAP